MLCVKIMPFEGDVVGEKASEGYFLPGSCLNLDENICF